LAPKRYARSSRLTFHGLMIFTILCATALADWPADTAQHLAGRKGRIFVLMIWDGLRPDLVTEHDTPNLFALSRAGTRFKYHHANFPTVTMANAAALATGTPPGVNGLLGNVIYFAPFFPHANDARLQTDLRRLVARPRFIENSKLLMRLNGEAGLDGRLLNVESIGQTILREGGYLAVLGKKGPTFLFDDRVATVANGRDGLGFPHRDYLFVASDLIEPEYMARVLAPQMPGANNDDDIAFDTFTTRTAINYALPRAKAAAEAGRPALVILWQRNPDAVQHHYGLGTAESIRSLSADDANLGMLRQAIDSLGIEPITDLMVVSDHGFATIGADVDLTGSLVEMGLKRSADSDEIVVATNGGNDEIILSRTKFPDEAARHEVLRKIVEFAALQEWCGPIFSRPEFSNSQASAGAPIEGTFSLAQLGLYDRERSPDLIISFNELSELDNSSLTGPDKPGFLFDARGRHPARNDSAELIRPVKGVVYNDFGPYSFSTGLGMHGAAGERELHNFAAALGPDFQHGFVDQIPTGNSDVAPTIAAILGLDFPTAQGIHGPHGRVMREALAADIAGAPAVRRFELRARMIVGQTIVTSILHLSSADTEDYLDASEVTRLPANAPSQR
jgi:hypothetical protein